MYLYIFIYFIYSFIYLYKYLYIYVCIYISKSLLKKNVLWVGNTIWIISSLPGTEHCTEKPKV